MYQNDITVTELVTQVLSSINVVPEIPGTIVAQYLTELQTRLHLGVVRLKKHISISLQNQGEMKWFSMTNIFPGQGEDVASEDDLCMVFVDSERVLFAEGEAFFMLSIPVYTCMDGKICLRNVTENSASIVYIARPLPITYTEGTGYSGKICMPCGYVSILRAGLRAALCRHVADDEGYRRYSAEYNDLLSDLKTFYLENTGDDDV